MESVKAVQNFANRFESFEDLCKYYSVINSDLALLKQVRSEVLDQFIGIANHFESILKHYPVVKETLNSVYFIN